LPLKGVIKTENKQERQKAKTEQKAKESEINRIRKEMQVELVDTTRNK